MTQSLRKGAAGRCLSAALLGAVLVHPAAQAAVNGNYQGMIDSDSGLGLIGQTMRVDFAYDENTAPDFSSAGNSFFQSFLQSMTVTIGARSWSWDPAGYSSMFLYNDTVNTFLVGVEDSVNASAYTFNGPSLLGPPVASSAYSLDIYLKDNQPTGSPDGLSTHSALPGEAPNPDLFRVDGANTNTMVFRFYTGDGEINTTYYSIGTAGVALAAPVPEPSVALMLLAGLGAVGAISARRRRKMVC